MTERICKTEKFLREKLAESRYFMKKPESGAYRLEHSIRVSRIAGEIARAEGMDDEAAIIAGLLHDVSYCLDFDDDDDWKNHGRNSARIARPFLETLGMDEKTVNDILYGIAIHVDDEADFEWERTPFALTVGDADNIDRFDAFRLYETLEKAGYKKLSFAEKSALTESTLERLEEFAKMKFATPAATSLWQERIGFYRDFYLRLRAQLSAGTGYLEVERSESVPVPQMNENLIELSGHF